MKKGVCLLLVVLVCTGVAYAEALRLKSDQELFAMYQEIQSILLARSSECTIELNAGTYTVGSDIPSGEYRVECSGAYSSAIVKVYENKDSAYPDASYTMAELYNSSVVGKLVLAKGNILDITGSKVKISSYNAATVALDLGDGSTLEPVKSQEDDEAEFVLYPGKYKVGEEIPVGIYRVVQKDLYGMVILDLFDSTKSLMPSYTAILSAVIGNGEIGKLELEKGNVVQVSEGRVTFYKYTGIK